MFSTEHFVFRPKTLQFFQRFGEKAPKSAKALQTPIFRGGSWSLFKFLRQTMETSRRKSSCLLKFSSRVSTRQGVETAVELANRFQTIHNSWDPPKTFFEKGGSQKVQVDQTAACSLVGSGILYVDHWSSLKQPTLFGRLDFLWAYGAKSWKWSKMDLFQVIRRYGKHHTWSQNRWIGHVYKPFGVKGSRKFTMAPKRSLFSQNFCSWIMLNYIAWSILQFQTGTVVLTHLGGSSHLVIVSPLRLGLV